MDTLLVFPNPYAGLDRDGHACGAYPHDSRLGYQPHHLVGAKRSATVHEQGTPLGAPMLDTFRPHRQTTKLEYELDPVRVPHDRLGHYAFGVRSGDLLAADAETAAECGVDFVDPKKLLEQKRAEALARYRAAYGKDPAFASEPCPLLGAE